MKKNMANLELVNHLLWGMPVLPAAVEVSVGGNFMNAYGTSGNGGLAVLGTSWAAMGPAATERLAQTS